MSDSTAATPKTTTEASPADSHKDQAGSSLPPAHWHQKVIPLLGEKWRQWREEELEAHPLFWILFALLLVTAAVLRTFHIDMPPFDFPADRQHSNASMIEFIRQGNTYMASRHSWIELRILPWITARTSWLRHIFCCEIWTLARGWSVFFGLLAVGMAAYAGYWAAADPGASQIRRRRIALLWMAAMAFNPYHQALSRMISTESVTLAMQMCAVGFFCAGYRNPRQPRYFILFIIFFVLAGWAKIPSIIWLPAFFICYLFHLATRPRTRILGLGAVALGSLAIFWVYQVNPFAIYQSYVQKFAYFAMHTSLWMGHELWNKTYVSRIILMLTLPGTFFALIGLATAPWLFRMTMASFLILFYFLINLNLYNFAHAIIPGMALAAWGINSLIEVRRPKSRVWSPRAMIGQMFAIGLVLAIILLLYPLGPKDPQKSVPRGEVLQAVKVIKQYVPQGTKVYNDDNEGSLNYMLRQWEDVALFSLDMHTGYFYSINRFSDKALQYAAKAWVKWASLPGEAGGVLYTRQPAALSARQADDYLQIKKDKTAPELPFGIENFYLPKKNYDPYHRILNVHPGDSIKIGITWKNDRGAPLAGIRWSSAAWRQYLPVPIREGGLAVSFGGILCLPQGARPTAFYTFEIPQEMPIGTYGVNCYAQDESHWHSPNDSGLAWPFSFEIASPDESIPSGTIERNDCNLYSADYYGAPIAWSDRWFYRKMVLEGYRTNSSLTQFISCPMRQPGIYELTIEGEASPVGSPVEPQDLWPGVDVFTPRDKNKPVAQIRVNSEKTGEFKGIFTAYEPFDSLMLRARCENGGGEAPLWLCHFIPASYGRQTITLRKIRFELKHPLLPGLIDIQPKVGAGCRPVGKEIEHKPGTGSICRIRKSLPAPALRGDDQVNPSQAGERRQANP